MFKDPASVLDYGCDWSAWLAAVNPDDTIATSTWSVDAGLTVGVDTHDTTTTTVWLSGGTVGASPYKAVNRIVTAGGRTDERTIRISVRDR